MKCQEIYQYMQAYLDRELSAEDEKRLEVHLRLCPVCKKRLFSLQKTVTHVESIGEVVVSEDFMERLLERLPEDVVSAEEKEALLRERRAAQRTVVSPQVMTADPQAPIDVQGTTVRLPRGAVVNGDLTIIGGMFLLGGTVQGDLRLLRGELVRLPGGKVTGKVTQITSPVGLWVERALGAVKSVWRQIKDI